MRRERRGGKAGTTHGLALGAQLVRCGAQGGDRRARDGDGAVEALAAVDAERRVEWGGGSQSAKWGMEGRAERARRDALVQLSRGLSAVLACLGVGEERVELVGLGDKVVSACEVVPRELGIRRVSGCTRWSWVQGRCRTGTPWE